HAAALYEKHSAMKAHQGSAPFESPAAAKEVDWKVVAALAAANASTTVSETILKVTQRDPVASASLRARFLPGGHTGRRVGSTKPEASRWCKKFIGKMPMPLARATLLRIQRKIDVHIVIPAAASDPGR